jgi:hypothetical protein
MTIASRSLYAIEAYLRTQALPHDAQKLAGVFKSWQE